MTTTEIKSVNEVLLDLRNQYVETIEFLKTEVANIDKHLELGSSQTVTSIPRATSSPKTSIPSGQYDWWKGIKAFFKGRKKVATTTEIVDFLFPTKSDKEKLELRKACSGALGRQKRKPKPTVKSIENAGERGALWGLKEYFDEAGNVREEHKA